MSKPEKKAESLAGQRARLIHAGGLEEIITFGDDVSLTWAGGSILGHNTTLYPEIQGTIVSGYSFKDVKGAELVLDDQRVFWINFYNDSFFAAYLSPIQRATLSKSTA